jgi:hypothetical protein
LGSPTSPWHWLISLDVGGVSFAQRPFAEQLVSVPPLLEQPTARTSTKAADSIKTRAPMGLSLPDTAHSVERRGDLVYFASHPSTRG